MLNSIKNSLKSLTLKGKYLTFIVSLAYCMGVLCGYKVSKLFSDVVVTKDHITLGDSICAGKGGVYSIKVDMEETLLQCTARTEKNFICITNLGVNKEIDMNSLIHADSANGCKVEKEFKKSDKNQVNTTKPKLKKEDK